MKRPILVLGLLIAFNAAAIPQNLETRVEVVNDGWKLVGDLIVPKASGPVPAVILLNKANGNRQAYSKLAFLLAAKNIASIRVDLRGHGESINKGKFVPFQENAPEIMSGADTDIRAVTEFLRIQKGIDVLRIGLVGASYSGEEMAVAARKSVYQKAYVALSPGSFSDESLNAIDSSRADWLFIRSVDERSMKTFPERMRTASKSSVLIEVAGSKHATDIFESNPELLETIAGWFKKHL